MMTLTLTLPVFSDMLLAIALGYFLGAIPFGLLLTRLAGHGDVRQIGSGNIGATNVLRTGNKKLAALTLALDMLKGFLAVWLIMQLMGNIGAALAAVAVVLGHVYPLWLMGKGGRGVATVMGVFFAFSPMLGGAAIIAWLILFARSKTSSISSLSAMLVAAVTSFWLVPGLFAYVTVALALLVFSRHRDNMARIIAGTEPKVSFSKG